ncbi:serine beta-lactamase-like protein LACTB, mitochondrial [Oppia nitens]|uniref:serine beta-lactamase-like protein LACTB, mitochondrial n=1 Tax=Oppia nitens TaxID=1686743 RepID=UPI0023D97956|nr:serine beta-lactamase-like protein LACTB, mitochondrial [Oppia nitens]
MSIILKLFIITNTLISLSSGQLENFRQQLIDVQKWQHFDVHKNYTNIDDVISDARKELQLLLTNQSIPGAVVAFSIKGKTVWSESFGLADIENNVTTHVDSMWRLCSISKAITSVLVGQLLEKKLLDLDKPIDNYLPLSLFPIHRYNGTDYKLTLRQLMSHTAGLHVSDVSKDFQKFFKATNITQMIRLFNNEPLLYKPGTDWRYSNYGIQLVGAIIESILETNFVDEMHKLFAKIGLNSTVMELHENLVKHRPRYYTALPDKPTVLQNSDLTDDVWFYEGYWPSGGILSTVTDMLRFGNLMIDAYHGTDQSIVSQLTIKELWKPETVSIIIPQLHFDYGKQWMIYKMNSSYPYKLVVGHAGGIMGTSTQLTLFPNEYIVGTVFTNKGYVTVLPDFIARVAEKLKNFI